MEHERPDHRSPSPSLRGRHRYAPFIIADAYVRSTVLVLTEGTGIAAVYTLTLIRQDIVFNLEQERITNAFFSCTLALNAICTGPVSRIISRGPASFDISSSLTHLGLIAFRIWGTQRQTRDAKMGSNLMHVSIIVIESGTFQGYSFAEGTGVSHMRYRNRRDLSIRVSLRGGNLYSQVASLQYLLRYRKCYLQPLAFISAHNTVTCRPHPQS
jgi:hypothetical protein